MVWSIQTGIYALCIIWRGILTIGLSRCIIDYRLPQSVLFCLKQTMDQKGSEKPVEPKEGGSLRRADKEKIKKVQSKQVTRQLYESKDRYTDRDNLEFRKCLSSDRRLVRSTDQVHLH